MIEQRLYESAETVDKIHKNPKMNSNNKEVSVHKDVTIVTGDNNPGRYKSYHFYGYTTKDNTVYHGSRPGASIFHHQHDLKSSNGIAFKNENDRIKKEGRYEVRLHHPMQLPSKVHYVKTAAAAKKMATEHAKEYQSKKVGNAKAASDFGYTGKHSKTYLDRSTK